ncbi:putative Histidine kinase [Candidatus Propionivibrio aalborgensis]|uniref:histidine kinase n=1 Tax=Candidatus Propionivibrio aalborgensis TaxID=1860101 RepID=A0A1A8XZ76_9RHOO|nr:ATP-binding protein [Candidatus Propionivibrio aalborgensis]SBT10259.1 putative Histidine kinase [Candidatus Propionivibrio aalborgensis]
MMNENDRFARQDKFRQPVSVAARSTVIEEHLPEDLTGLSSDEIGEMVLELRAHQIELEMQNENLHRTQAALDASRALYYDLYNLAPVGYCTLSEAGVILEANHRIAALLGTMRGTLIKQPIFRFIHREDQDVFYFHRKRLLESSQPQQCELRMLTVDGTLLWMHLNSNATRDEAGTVMLRITLNDITERKRFEDELVAARKLAEQAVLVKSRFLAAASHDLRQPLQAINLFNDALIGTGLSDEQKQISGHLSQSISSLNELLNVLLDLSKLDAGIIKANPEVIEVEKFFLRCDAEFSPITKRKRLSFRLCFPLKPMAIIADRELLRSLMGNLIFNAIKYTQQGGVLVAIRQRGTKALIQVWDTGIGIPAEHIHSIFEEYFQIENPERVRRRGLGLGLAIVRRQAKLLGTEVACRSRPGKGSVFEFSLPLAVEAQEEVPPQNAIDRAIVDAYKGRRIVVVEDDAMVANAIKLSLESVGMCVAVFQNAEEALSDAETLKADFYVSDYRLPGLDGERFLENILKRSTKPFRAVLLTGDTTPGWIEKARSLRWPVLFKPIDLPQLLTTIQSQAAST